MGMFDWVINVPDTYCVQCEQPLEGWQTKDHIGGCLDIDYKKITNFYTFCEKCRTWHEYQRETPEASSLEDFELKIKERK